MFSTVVFNKPLSAVIKSSADNGEREVGRNSFNSYSTGILREGGKEKKRWSGWETEAGVSKTGCGQLMLTETGPLLH